MGGEPAAAVAALQLAGVEAGDEVALALAPGAGVALVPVGRVEHGWSTATLDPVAVIAAVERDLRPRWAMWSGATATELVRGGVRVAAGWDIAAVHRILFGGWRAGPALVWAQLRDLDPSGLPSDGPPDLFSEPDTVGDGPLRPDGFLRPSWLTGWAGSPERLERWAGLAAEVVELQRGRLHEVGSRAPATARAESATELLCAELGFDGLPVDRVAAEAIVAGFVGPRPAEESEAAQQRAHRDARVLRHAPAGSAFDLRSPGQVRSLLRAVGIEVTDTRAWRLEALSGAHPVVADLLAWRKAERVATTYGYGWLDDHLDDDGRLRGTWSGADGAAGRMTASAGLHNMPADMRPAVVADPGHVFVRADLGQIEPRVLAAVSGDRVLASATTEDDLYAPVADQLGVDREIAKVAVLGAMYGQTTGRGAEALHRLHATYPVAMAHLDAADREGRAGRDLRTHGGRLIRLGAGADGDVGGREDRARAAARGRYARNALVQGAAAELFKVWAVTVRARASALGGRIVLCLHDELLVHAPAERAAAVHDVVSDGLQEAVARWAPGGEVRFVADVRVLTRWSDAKG